MNIKYSNVILILSVFLLGCVNKETNFQTIGTVISIDWKSKNHQLPKIGIREKVTGKIKYFHGGIILDSKTLKVGDLFEKKRGSSDCKINEVLVRCINPI